MNDFTYQKSLPLSLRPSFGRHDFIVGESNKDAVSSIDSLHSWSQDGLLIVGPSSSGKTHLVSIFKHKYECNILSSKNIDTEEVEILNLKNLIIENLENINNHKFLLHIINITKEKKFKFILTSRLDVHELNIKLKDLSSRLFALPQVRISLPTDDVLRGIIIKISKDKGLPLNNLVINFMLNHIERSYAAINIFITQLDKLALERKRKITIPLVKTLIKINSQKTI